MINVSGRLSFQFLFTFKVYYGSGSTFSTQKVASNKMAYFLEALVPFTQYIINVTALTKKGEGEPISTSFKTLQAGTQLKDSVL